MVSCVKSAKKNDVLKLIAEIGGSDQVRRLYLETFIDVGLEKSCDKVDKVYWLTFRCNKMLYIFYRQLFSGVVCFCGKTQSKTSNFSLHKSYIFKIIDLWFTLLAFIQSTLVYNIYVWPGTHNKKNGCFCGWPLQFIGMVDSIPEVVD